MEITNTSFLGNVHLPAEYLDDGAYAIFDGDSIWVVANSHREPTDKVCLGPSEFDALVRFNKDCRSEEVIRECLSRNEH